MKEVSGTRKKPETQLARILAKLMEHTIATCKNHYLHPEVVRYCLDNDCEELNISQEFEGKDYKTEEKKLMAILQSITED